MTPSGEDEIRCCELCGGAVMVEGSIGGTRYYVPISNEFLEVLMDDHVDQFIRDRLRRCERIVTELRKEVKSLKGEA